MSGYAYAVGENLRRVRTQQGLSLQAVEVKSQGRWKAVVVGSYERGDRAVTVQRLSDLARFYSVPLVELLPGAGALSGRQTTSRLVLDLEQIAGVPAAERVPLARYAASIQRQRGDYNGRVLSVRDEDLRSLSVLLGAPPEQVEQQLAAWGVLSAA